jgi:multiple sugar transport system ATP-binding protein
VATVTLKDIKKSYGAVSVIKGVDLSIDDREFCVFVGPSGCGKSTLLRMIAGLEEITSGDLLIDGQRVNDVPPSERGLAMVFQSYALYPHMSVADNMAFSLRLAGVSKAERRAKVAEAARVLHLDQLLERKPKELSGGQRQRVAIGRAIVRTPALFLFDEPLSNLDAALRVATRLEIARLHRELRATMIYVTHDQVEAMTLADRIVVLNAGRIEQVGRPMELYDDPANVFVAGFIGSPQMNFLDAARLGAPGKTLGVRPEHLAISRDAGPIAGRISHVERLGSETNVFIAADDHGLVTARIFGETPFDVDKAVRLTPNPTRVFHFDDAGRRLRPPAPGA